MRQPCSLVGAGTQNLNNYNNLLATHGKERIIIGQWDQKFSFQYFILLSSRTEVLFSLQVHKEKEKQISLILKKSHRHLMEVYLPLCLQLIILCSVLDISSTCYAQGKIPVGILMIFFYPNSIIFTLILLF